MNILVEVLKQIIKEEIDYDTSILVLKDSNSVDLNLQVSYCNELVELKTIKSYDLRKSDESEKYISDLRYLHKFFDVIIMKERKED